MMMDSCQVLKNSKTIAIVGISRDPNRISRDINRYLIRHGYDVMGVNPNKSFTEADGIVVFNKLTEISKPIDIINVFRKSEDIPELVDDILSVKPKTLWLQLGIYNDESAMLLTQQGINVIQDSCIKIEHSFCQNQNN